jgi:hypothetical protein
MKHLFTIGSSDFFLCRYSVANRFNVWLPIMITSNKMLMAFRPYFFAIIGFLVFLSCQSCSSDEMTATQPKMKLVEVLIQGNSPECFFSSTDCATIKITQAHIFRNVKVGDVITAIGYGYTIDNSNNYNAPNVNVIGYITIKVNGVVVANGIDFLAYQIK